MVFTHTKILIHCISGGYNFIHPPRSRKPISGLNTSRQFVQVKGLWCTNRETGTIALQREGGSREAVLSENLCPPRTCAALGTFGRGSASAPSSAAPGLPIPLRYIPASAVALRCDGTASAVVVERQRGFQGKPKQRSHRPRHREGRMPLKGAVSAS